MLFMKSLMAVSNLLTRWLVQTFVWNSTDVKTALFKRAHGNLVLWAASQISIFLIYRLRYYRWPTALLFIPNYNRLCLFFPANALHLFFLITALYGKLWKFQFYLSPIGFAGLAGETQVPKDWEPFALVIDTLLKARKPSSQWIYHHNWRAFFIWCKSLGFHPWRFIPCILAFF